MACDLFILLMMCNAFLCVLICFKTNARANQRPYSHELRETEDVIMLATNRMYGN
jgi:hypothetical protein